MRAPRLFVSGLIAGALASPLAAQPVVSSVVAQQRENSTWVDISYGLQLQGATEAIIAVAVSNNGGSSYEYARPQSLAGGTAWGSGVTVGVDKRIAWDASLQGWSSVRYPSTEVAITASFVGNLEPIPAGAFTQGSPTTEPGRNSTTEVQRSVTLTQPFQLQSTEVTWKQWNEVRAWALTNGYSDLAFGQKGSAGTTANTDL
ncbi:SUMF1/EgtB/PvdO family nonheme iron enzyme, partial [Novosphingobium sp.]|uniref:SUMF1/EgtB/PvdO family nonheme iron enzyme n=1 Tax=Novosphingobium sp. TaxID=1874826 RepID=UPI00262C2FF6